jgi:hypothetical protein
MYALLASAPDDSIGHLHAQLITYVRRAPTHSVKVCIGCRGGGQMALEK